MNVSSFICQVCNKSKSNYTCPRCNAMYCALPCYKKHDEQCTTQFYSSHVMDYIKNERATKEESIDMAKKLKAFYNQQVQEDEERDKMLFQQKIDNQLLNENLDKLHKLALDDKININDLTQYQQKQFANAIKSGELQKHINIWNPWWNKRDIIITPETDESDANISLIIPPLPIDIASYDSLNAKNPSLLLPYLLCDILCGYVSAMIRYNGDWNDEPSHVLQLILSISCVLCNKQCIHNDFEQLTNTLMENYVAQSVKNNKLEILLYLKQVCILLSNKINVLRALNQMYELIHTIQSQIISNAKVSKLLNKKMKNNLENKTNQEKEIKKTKGNYYDEHADNFMTLMNVETKKEGKTKKLYSYSSSFAPEKMRKNTRKQCKKLDPLKRKIWYYLVWFNQYISNERSILLASELKVIVQHTHSKLTKMENQIKTKMVN